MGLGFVIYRINFASISGYIEEYDVQYMYSGYLGTLTTSDDGKPNVLGGAARQTEITHASHLTVL